MLDAFIIDELRRREQEKVQDRERPVLEIPEPDEAEAPAQSNATESEPERGVAVIDFTV